jgi:oligopeptide/dipeptide ABC transporter ATP-binding protein
VVAELADDILVMYAGRPAEYGSAMDIFSRPGHPYTWGLLGSMPRLDRERSSRLIPIPGTPPSLIRVPSGCPFHPRCGYTGLTHGRCDTEVPPLRQVAALGHEAACHLTAEDRVRLWAALAVGEIPAEAREIPHAAGELPAEASAEADANADANAGAVLAEDGSAQDGSAQDGPGETGQPVTHDGVEA